jgi:hypothetical protein
MHLLLVDGIGPFFQRIPAGLRVNWSKIPFARLERDGVLDDGLWRDVRRDFAVFAHRVATLGFNAVTLDDVAHLYDAPHYPARLRRTIASYRRRYRELFSLAAAQGLSVFVTTDVMFFTPHLERRLGDSPTRIACFLRDATASLLDDFPEVAGVILRIGESDGVDTDGDFRSRIVLRSPSATRRLLRILLPSFEERRRLLVLRTWSVGAYPMGDLIWNRNTLRAILRGIRSPSLILSMKHGESDFFRYLPLAKQFFRTEQPKIVELQARREYEGFGEYPSFIGWDHLAIREQLTAASNVVGVSVWTQTGGWSKFRRRTFLDPPSVWNEINTEVTAHVFRDGVDVDEAVSRFCAARGRPESTAPLLELLRLSDEVIKELLYIEDLARQKLFFRRLRIPPLLSVYWDHILVNHSMRKLLRCLVRDGERAMAQGERSLEKIQRMIDLAPSAGMPVEDLLFQKRTFEILVAARRYYFDEYSPDVARRLLVLRERYRALYPEAYTVHLDFSPMRLERAHLHRLLSLILRRQRGYRWVDRILTIRLLALLSPFVRRMPDRVVPEVAKRQAMGIDSILR